VRAAGGVGPGDHLGLERVDGQLEQGVVEDDDVVGGGARAGVARPQQGGEWFAGGVQVGHERVVTEPALVGRRRALLLRVRADQGGVEVDHVEPGIHAPGPRVLAGMRAGQRDLFEHDLVDRFERAPGRGRRRDTVEQLRLVAQHRQVRDAGAAIGDHHRQVPQHLTPVVAPPALLRRGQRDRQPDREPDVVSHVRQEPGAGVVHQTPPTAGHPQPLPTVSTLHPRSALLLADLLASTPTESLARRAASRIGTYTTAGPTEQAGLVGEPVMQTCD